MREQTTTGATKLNVDEFNIDPKLVHEIHTSERKSFKGCRRRWAWISRDMWYPKITAKPLEFGVAYHKAMEVFYDPARWHSHDVDIRTDLAIMAFVELCEKQRRGFLAVNDSGYLPDEIQKDYDERVELGKGMLNYYCRTISPEVDLGFKPVKVEIRFMVLIKGPAGEILRCKCQECHQKWTKADFPQLVKGDSTGMFRGLPVVYAGRLDALMEDRHGDYWIYDWKTARSISQNDEFLYLDDQIGSYVWALRAGINLPVRGFVYHEQKKGFPQAPSENKTIRLGRKFSVNSQQDTDYDTYLETVQKYDNNAFSAGLYDEFLDWLKSEGPTFYKRYQIHKSDDELAEIGRNLYDEAVEMINPDLPLYPNAGRFSCGFCAFRSPCMGKNAREDYMYTLATMFEKREHYYVREEASTESKGAE